MPLTITEALAEIKTIGKRIDKKQEFVLTYLGRQEGLKDPLEKDGGSVEAIRRERQAITDLLLRVGLLRRGIARANEATQVTIGPVSMSIAEWLTWRRDIAPTQQSHMMSLRQRLIAYRDAAKRSGATVIQGAVASVSADTKPTDILINVDEAELARQIEQMEETLGALDGQLSLKNATIIIEEAP